MIKNHMYFLSNRDEAQNKMLALKEKADKEMSQYNMELKELARVIDHDRKLREFMSRKDQERSQAHEEMEAMKRKREAEKSSESCLLYTSPSPRDATLSRMPSSA